MAYLMWDDEGVIQFLQEFEPSFIERFATLARNVERSDVFRIMVTNYIGGVVSYPLLLDSFFRVPGFDCDLI